MLLRSLMFGCFICIGFATGAHSDVITPAVEHSSIAAVGDEIWVAAHLNAPHITLRGYVLRFQPINESWELEKFDRPVLAIVPEDSTVWLGTYGAGLIHWVEETHQEYRGTTLPRHEPIRLEHLLSDYVFAIHPTPTEVYCATPEGLSILNTQGQTWHSFTPSNSPLPAHTIYDIEESDGRLWMTTSDNWELYYEGDPFDGEEQCGLAVLDPSDHSWLVLRGNHKRFTDGRAIVIRGNVSIPGCSFYDIASTGSGELWVSYPGGFGIRRGDRWEFFDSRSCGIDLGSIAQVLPDENGIWLSTRTHLWHYEQESGIWTGIQGDSKQVPGSRLDAIYYDRESLWIRSSELWQRPDSVEQATIAERTRMKGIHPELSDALLNPQYVEYLTRYDGESWTSWELTEILLRMITGIE